MTNEQKEAIKLIMGYAVDGASAAYVKTWEYNQSAARDELQNVAGALLVVQKMIKEETI